MESKEEKCSNRINNIEEEEAKEAVEAWHEATEGAVLGSYTGMGEDCSDPVQDADDL